MDLGKKLMVAGIGCRAGVTVEQVEAAIEAAIEALCEVRLLAAIATPAAKIGEPGLQAAAAARGVPLLAIFQECLEAADSATVTRSEHSMAAMNVQSVAEAAALAGAIVLANGTDNPNPDASDMPTSDTHGALSGSATAPRLLQARVVVGPVTCALADTTTS